MKVSTLVNYREEQDEEDQSVLRLRKFLKKIECNMINTLNIEPNIDSTRNTFGYYILLSDFNGIRKVFPSGAPNPENKYYIRYFLNMYNNQSMSFYGNNYRSQQFEITFNDSGYIKLQEKVDFYAYILSPDPENDQCIVQIVLVECNKEGIILSQTCEGWSIFTIKSSMSSNANDNAAQVRPTNTTQVFLGSPLEIRYKPFQANDDTIEGIAKYAGASLDFFIGQYDEWIEIKYLIPDYIILSSNVELPGWLHRYLQEKPDNELIKTRNFDDIYLKNIEIEISPTLEEEIIEFAENYRKQKCNIDPNHLKKIIIKERRLKCGIHNTWCFINSNGLENCITLSKKSNENVNNSHLCYKGVLQVDNFFIDENSSIALIIEMNYTLTIPMSSEEPDKEETLFWPIGYSVFIPKSNIENEDTLHQSYFITGPGMTVYGEHWWSNDWKEQLITINFWISKSPKPCEVPIEEKTWFENKDESEDAIMTKKQNLSIVPVNNMSIEKLPEEVPWKHPAVDQNVVVIKPPRNVELQEEIVENYEITAEKYNQFLQFKQFQNMSKWYESQEVWDKQFEETQPKIIYGPSTKDISKKTRAEYISQGILDLDMQYNTPKSWNYFFNEECKGPDFGRLITFQFLGFTPRGSIEKCSFVPKIILFGFSFWEYTDLKSDSCVISKSDQMYILVKEGEINDPEYDSKNIIKIRYDPSTSTQMDFRSFFNYLYNKNMVVDIIDAEKNFTLGYIKIPLRDLCWQGKDRVECSKKYEIYNNDFEIEGWINVNLKNQKIGTEKPFIYNPDALTKINSFDGYNKGRNKKKVTCKQINLQNYPNENPAQKNWLWLNNNSSINIAANQSQANLRGDPDFLKKVRVLKYFSNTNAQSKYIRMAEKKSELNRKIIEDENFNNSWIVYQQIREHNKPDIIGKVGIDHHRNEITLAWIQGQPHYINYTISNESWREELFHIVITSQNSPEEDEKPENEVSIVTVVKKPKEWQSAIALNDFPKPRNYDLFTKNNDFLVESKEAIPIVFKWLSLESVDQTRYYTVRIVKNDGHVLYVLCITLMKVFPIVDHTFIYYVPFNRKNTLKFVNPFKSNNEKWRKWWDYKMWNNNINLLLESYTSDFTFNFDSGNEGEIQEFYLFFYLSEEQTELYITWKFEISSVKQIEISTNLGRKELKSLDVDSSLLNVDGSLIEDQARGRTLQLFSNMKDWIYFPGEYSKEFTLINNDSIHSKYVIYPKNVENKDALVNIVNTSSRELLKSWLVTITATPAKIKENLHLVCKKGHTTNVLFSYTNHLLDSTVLIFDSSNEDVLKIPENEILFSNDEKKPVQLVIPSNSEVGETEVLVFIHDKNGDWSETLMFIINYN